MCVCQFVDKIKFFDVLERFQRRRTQLNSKKNQNENLFLRLAIEDFCCLSSHLSKLMYLSEVAYERESEIGLDADFSVRATRAAPYSYFCSFLIKSICVLKKLIIE